jgi:hypothetical protein
MTYECSAAVGTAWDRRASRFRMVVFATKAPSLLMHGNAGELSLRVKRTGHDAQTVELAACKCTIGSARGCTLRLRADGVRPIECLILRGPQAAAIRAWAPGVRLNGQEVGDALLQIGDRIGIGPVELEILAIGAEGTPSLHGCQAEWDMN